MAHRGKPGDITEAYYRGSDAFCGYRRKDLDKPQIAVVNSWTDVNPGHQPLKELSAPCEGRHLGRRWNARVNSMCRHLVTVWPKDPGMHYILPQRDLIAASIEAMVRAHGFEGMVMLGSCDKILPGMLMAAIRLNIPTLFHHCRRHASVSLQGSTVITSDLKEAIGKRRIREIDQATFLGLAGALLRHRRHLLHDGDGQHHGMFSGGRRIWHRSVPTTMLAFDAAKARQASDVGERIVSLTREQRPSGIFSTGPALENGIKCISASGGSTNAVLHLMA